MSGESMLDFFTADLRDRGLKHKLKFGYCCLQHCVSTETCLAELIIAVGKGGEKHSGLPLSLKPITLVTDGA